MVSREGVHCQKTISSYSSGNRDTEEGEGGNGGNVKLEESLSSQLEIE